MLTPAGNEVNDKSNVTLSSLEQASHFLAPYGEAPDGWLAICTVRRGRSALVPHWFTVRQLAKASAYAALQQQAHVYVSPWIQREKPSKGRGTGDNAAGLVGLYADIDIQAPDAHKETALPASLDEALAFVKALPVPPTLIVNSGNGVQPHWRWRENWMFGDVEEREQAHRLVLAWEGVIRDLAMQRGWKLDKVSDTARLLRVPGTQNVKTMPPKPVILHLWDGPRYEPGQIEELMASMEPSPQVTPGSSVTPTLPPSNGAAPIEAGDRVSVNRLLSRALERVWDQKGAGRNATGLWLACQLRDNGYAQTDAAGVLQRYQEAAKGEPDGHGGHTPYAVDEAMVSVAQAYSRPPREPWGDPLGAAEEDETPHDPSPGNGQEGKTAEARRKFWERLQAEFRKRGYPLVGVRKMNKRRARFDFLLGDERFIEIGTAADVLNPRAVQAAIADAIPVTLPEMSRKRWRLYADAIFAMAGEGDDTGADPESDARGWLGALTAGYSPGHKSFTVDITNHSQLGDMLTVLKVPREIHVMSGKGQGFCWGRQPDSRLCLYVHLETLVNYIRGPFYGQRTTRPDTAFRLKGLGFVPDRLDGVLPDGTPIQMRLWRSPPGFEVGDE